MYTYLALGSKKLVIVDTSHGVLERGRFSCIVFRVPPELWQHEMARLPQYLYIQILRPRIPHVAIVSYTSNIPQNDV